MSKIGDLMGTGFRPDKQTDKLNDEFMSRLGLVARFGPARLAIAFSLSLPEQVSADANFDHDKGREIRGQQLLGVHPGEMTSLVVQRAGRSLDKRELQNLVAAHWRRGLKKMDKIWKEVDGDHDKFLKILEQKSAFPSTDKSGVPANAPLQKNESTPEIVRCSIGKSVQNAAEVHWNVNAPGGSPHVAVMGETNTGKTRIALDIAEQIKRQSDCAVLVFDMGKGDIAEHEKSNSQLGAAVLECPRNPVPLDILHVADKSDNSIIQTIASRFCDSLAHISQGGLGDIQRATIREILLPLLAERQSVPISAVLEAAQEHYDSNGKREDTVIAALKLANSFNLFSPEQPPQNFLRGGKILDLHGAEESVQRFVVLMVLTALSRHIMNQPDSPTDEAGNRKITTLLVIDEARKVLGKNHPALMDIVRMGRSKGCVVMLISQSPDDYRNEVADFLTDIGVNVCFRTNAAQKSIERVFKRKVQVANLSRGECYVRLPGTETQKVKVWG